MPMLPRLQLPYCDVRDVAAAHIKCLTLPDAPGKFVKKLGKKCQLSIAITCLVDSISIVQK